MPKVTIDGFVTVDAAHVLPDRWNGWTQPYFTAAQIRAIQFYGASIPILVEQLNGNDVPEFILYETEQEASTKVVPEHFPVFDEPLYGLGAGYWVWEQADELTGEPSN